MANKPTKDLEQPVFPRGILLRGLKVLQRFEGPLDDDDLRHQQCVMRIMQIGAVAERSGWMKKARSLTSPGVSSKWDAMDMMLNYGKLKDRADKRKPQGLGGITYKKKGTKPNRTGTK